MTTNDCETAVNELHLKTTENRRLFVDFNPYIQQGDKVVGVTSITALNDVAEAPVVTDERYSNDGKVVSARFNATASRKRKYTFQIITTVQTADGETDTVAVQVVLNVC
jgi:hypothetical protein